MHPEDAEEFVDRPCGRRKETHVDNCCVNNQIYTKYRSASRFRASPAIGVFPAPWRRPSLAREFKITDLLGGCHDLTA